MTESPGDPPQLIAQSSRIGDKLGWQPKHADLDRIIADTWRWEQTRGVGGN